MGELLQLEKEPLKSVDSYAVAVIKGGTVVEHVLQNFPSCFFHFLMRSQNKGVLEERFTTVLMCVSVVWIKLLH